MILGIFIDTWKDGGSRLFPRKLEAELTRRGHTVYLILGDSHPWRDVQARQGYAQLEKELGDRCFSLERQRYKSKNWTRHRLQQFIQQRRLSCLLINDYKDFLGELEFISEFVPLVSIAHSDHSDYYHAEYLPSEKFIQGTVCPSRQIHAQLQQLTPPQRQLLLHRIPYGVKQNADFVPSTSGPMQVRVCSRLDFYHKRVQDLPGIWKKYLALGGTGQLTCLGSGEALAYLQKELAEETADGSVRFLGQVPAGEVQRELAAGDLFLSTSAYEGLPQTVLEATCYGLYPLLTRINSGHQEIIADLGLGRSFPVGDQEGCARALLELEQELARIRSQRRAIREKALELYAFDRVILAYETLLQKIAREPQAEVRLDAYRPTLKERLTLAANTYRRARAMKKAGKA